MSIRPDTPRRSNPTRPMLLALAGLCLMAAKPFDPADWFAHAAQLPNFEARLRSATQALLNRPYRLDPLGEARAPDADPRLRFDSFDCTTFVETALALARAPSPGALLPTLDAIRYDGPAAYENRNHFFDSQWIGAATRNGLVRDITHAVAGDRAIDLTKTVTLAQWNARRDARRIVLPEARAPLGSHLVSYIPLDAVNALAGRIPSGTVFAVVSADRPTSPFLVTHVGFVFQAPGGETFVRHANKSPHYRTLDEPLARLVARLLKPRGRPVLGLQLLQPLDPAPSAFAD